MDVVPAAVAGGLILAGAGILLVLLPHDGGPDERPADVVLDVAAFRYAYEPGTEANITIQKDALVTLRITSTDVTHGFAISEFGVFEEIPAGKTVEVTFRADTAGEFTIYCTVFCGTGHPGHKGTLHVV